MARTTPLLKDEQWQQLEPLLPKTAPGKQGGRPWCDNRQVLEGILWVLRSGARWRDLPERYPSPGYLLAAIEAVGGFGYLAECLARAISRTR